MLVFASVCAGVYWCLRFGVGVCIFGVYWFLFVAACVGVYWCLFAGVCVGGYWCLLVSLVFMH